MASSGGGGGGNHEGQPHLRINALPGSSSTAQSTTRRLREDLQNVVRSSLTPLIEGHSPTGPPSSLASHLSSLLPGSLSSSLSPPWAASPPTSTTPMSNMPNIPTWSGVTTQTSPTTWQDNITVTLQPAGPMQPVPPHQPSHVLDIEVFQPQPPPPDGEPAPGPGQQQPPPEPENGWSAILNSNPELRAVVSACEKYIPFLLIILVKSVFEHGTGIVVCCGLVLTFLHANSVLKQQVARQSRRNLGALIAISVNLIACILFIYFVFLDDNLCLSAFFVPPEKVATFYDLLWIVGVNDFILKFIAVLAKILVTVLPAKIMPYQKRGKYYLFFEVTSQLHRQLAPLQPWLMYLLHSKGEGAGSIPNKVLGVFLTAAYMVVKGKIFMKAIKLWRAAFYKLLQSTRYGKTPNQDQMKASGGFCPICQEPTMLHCKHIFCEECVATWFDRDTTCPMCRAKVSEDPSWRDGATSQFIQLF
eukprot:GFUD01084508.1.p1 GENE.GFUD01084508.1~~GFUD01084508.1.p1  ORF type:complete len:474 (-),score=124.98 GFUD01084508.1:140-1561(-)